MNIDANTEGVLTQLRGTAEKLRLRFPAAVPLLVAKLDIESRKDDEVRLFRYLIQTCRIAAINVKVAHSAQLGVEIDAYVQAAEHGNSVALYAAARILVEHAALAERILLLLRTELDGQQADWRQRGQRFHKVLARAMFGTRDRVSSEILKDSAMPASVLEAFSTGECLSTLEKHTAFGGLRKIYDRLCDAVHPNLLAHGAGAEGCGMDSAFRWGNDTYILPVEHGIQRYNYPAPSRSIHALRDTAEIAGKSTKLLFDAFTTGGMPDVPFRQDEVRKVTGTDTGFRTLDLSRVPTDPYAPCLCGSAIKYKFCCKTLVEGHRRHPRTVLR